MASAFNSAVGIEEPLSLDKVEDLIGWEY